MRGILFDKDGTLLDFEATWDPVFQRLALEAAGGDEAGALRLLVAGGYLPEAGRYRPGSVLAAGASDAVAALLYPGLAAEAQAERIAHIDRAFHDHGSAHSVEIEGAVNILVELAGLGYVMGVATHDSTAASKAGLAALGMADYLPHIFGYDAVANRKPAPDLVHLFCAATGLLPEDVAVVGDNVNDLGMARSAGAVAIGVTSGNSSAADLAPFADAILDSIRDLPAWLAENG
jgi:phosphoglycolate phosphatase